MPSCISVISVGDRTLILSQDLQAGAPRLISYLVCGQAGSACHLEILEELRDLSTTNATSATQVLTFCHPDLTTDLLTTSLFLFPDYSLSILSRCRPQWWL